ncbi:hypothetical protein SDC9_90894 [bioreactor metagenome]|uniref:Uncharacterized protein n=1 Tax=bioreactor metagenome TaxID=1076179 RepID=A0A644ZU05_9ZZZZ
MKHIYFLFTAILLLNFSLSCSNDLLTGQDLSESDQYLTIENNDTIQPFAYCYGCLPMVTVYHDSFFNEFVIAWSGYTEDPVSHPVTLSYKAGGLSGNQMIGYNSGEIRENIYSESYTATWSIKCSNYNCSSCRESGSLSKKASGETETGSETECYKEYLNYSIERVSTNGNAFDLVLNDYNGDVYNTEKYMSINEIRFFELDSYGRKQEIYGAGSLDTTSAPYRIRFYLYNQPMFKNFQVTFSNNQCISNFEHYLYVNYRYSNFGIELLNSSLTLVRNH